MQAGGFHCHHGPTSTITGVDVVEVIQFRSLEPGPRVIITGAVHGNETCGTKALRHTVAQLERGERRVACGTLTLVPISNPVAYRKGTREGDRNLNRRFGPVARPVDAEDHIANQLAPLLAEHDALLDLHSFAAPGEPFVFIGPPNNQGEIEPFAAAETEAQMALAAGPNRIVSGWLSTYAAGAVQRAGASIEYGVGTTEYMRRHGGAAITVECGQHLDPNAPLVARNAIDSVLEALGTFEPAAMSPTPSIALPRRIEQVELTEVHDRLDPNDSFIGTWSSFDPLTAGQPVARRADGSTLRAQVDGFIVFPNPDTPVGTEWFYLARHGSRNL